MATPGSSTDQTRSIPVIGCLLVPLIVLSPFLVFGALAGFTTVLFLWPMRLVAMTTTWPGRLGLIALVAALHFGTRRLYAWQVARTMRRRAASLRPGSTDPAAIGGAAADVVPDPTRPDSRAPIGGPPAGTLEPERGSARPPLAEPPPLAFLEHGEDAVDLTDTEAEAWVRDRLLNLRGKAFFRGTLVAWGLSLALAVVLTGAWAATSEGEWFEGFIHLLPFGAALVLLLVVQRFTIGVGAVTALLAGLVANLWSFLFSIGTNQLDPREHLFGRAGFAIPFVVYLAALAIAAVVARRRYPTPAEVKSAVPRLLILRVFGADRTTPSLFRAVGRRWPLLGPSVTIADPTYEILTFRHVQNILLAFCMAPLIVLVSAFPTAALVVPAVAAGFGLYLIGLVVAFSRSLIRARWGAGTNLAALRQKLAFETSGLRRGYPSIRLTCFDDMWRATVQALVEWSDVVLIDLRGFTAERKGVEYELGLLLNTFPIEHMVFLVDGTTDDALLRETLETGWRTLAPGSPNRTSSDTTAHLYRVPEGTRGVGEEIGPLVSLLAEITADVPPRRGEADAAKVRTTARLVQVFVWLAWAVVAFGIFAQFRWSVDGIHAYSGTSIIWIGATLVTAATRMRLVLSTDGTLRTMFANKAWTAAFTFLVAGWLLWYSGLVRGGP